MRVYRIALLTAGLLVATQAFSEEALKIDFDSSSENSVTKLDGEELGNLLADTLSSLQRRCTGKAAPVFGQRIVSIKKTSSRQGTRTYTLETAGTYPAPSFAKYQAETTLTLILQRDDAPAAMDRGNRWKSKCRTKVSSVAEDQ